MARLIGFVFVASMTLPFSLSLQMSNLGAPTGESEDKPKNSEDAKNAEWEKPKNSSHDKHKNFKHDKHWENPKNSVWEKPKSSEHEKHNSSSSLDDEPSDPEDEEMLPSDNLTVWGSKYKSNGQYPRLAIGLSCPKCGSSFFYQVLASHPAIRTGVKKETQFFSGNGDDGKPLSACPKPKTLYKDQKTDFLNSCFKKTPAGKKQDPWNTNKTLFEFTPGYLTQAADDADIMLQFKGLDAHSDSRFLVVLRDPIERFVSELNMVRLNSDFMKAMSDKEMEAHTMKKVDSDSYSIRLGHYSNNLKMWLKNFPKERLLVINQAALDNSVAWRRVLKFLGLSHKDKGEEIMPRLVAHAKKFEDQVNNPKDGYLQLSDKATTRLKEHYHHHNQQLWKLLGVDPWW